MSWLAAAVVTSTVVGSYQQGKAQKEATKDQSEQLVINAARREREGEMDAAEVRRQNRILLGDARAAMASAGGVTTDNQALLQLGDIAGQGKFNELSYISEARLDAESMREGAQAVERSGRAAARTSYANGITSVLTSTAGSSLFGKFSEWQAARNTPAPVVSSTPSWVRSGS